MATHDESDDYSTVHATATARKVGKQSKARRDAWRDIAEVARSLAWLADREIRAYEPIIGTDADAATRCAALLERATVDRSDEEKRRNVNLVWPLLERSDAAVKALGGTVAVKVAGGGR